MQGDFEDDLPGMREGDGGGVTDQRTASTIPGNGIAGTAQTNAFDPDTSREILP